jgi:hypothetical protein
LATRANFSCIWLLLSFSDFLFLLLFLELARVNRLYLHQIHFHFIIFSLEKLPGCGWDVGFRAEEGADVKRNFLLFDFFGFGVVTEFYSVSEKGTGVPDHGIVDEEGVSGEVFYSFWSAVKRERKGWKSFIQMFLVMEKALKLTAYWLIS